MSNIKNKTTLYIVMRGHAVPCAITKTEEEAQRLCGVYEQQMLDAGATAHYSVQAQIYYDE